MSAESKRPLLEDRALFLQKARSFFSDRNVLEVDTPVLSKSAPVDEHIEIFPVLSEKGETAYLHSSPEYAMKRLLAEGSGDIFQIGHVFRKGEFGPLHNPEFTMVEWYRIEFPYEKFIEETVDFVRLFLGDLPVSLLSYRQAFLRYADIDPFSASREDLLKRTADRGIDLVHPETYDFDDLLHAMTGFLIEPHLGENELTVLTDYPPSQAALAKIEEEEGYPVARRFEIYRKGIELANGYLELTDARKQEERFVESNRKRASSGKPVLPIDYRLLQALQIGLPPCCGVAVGFDRLLLLKNRASHLRQVLPFEWAAV